jgi:hypothetical protein
MPSTTRRTTGTTSDRPAWSDRAGALTGAAYVLLILVGNQIATGGAQAAHPTGRQDLADFARAEHSTSMAVGTVMEVLGMLAFMFFLGWLVQALRSRGGAALWLAGTVAVAGTTTLAVKVASFAPMAAGILNRDSIDPTTARVLTDMNGAAFVVTFLTFGVFLLAAGLAILASGLLGRFAGWSAVVIGSLGIVLTLLSKVDPVNTNPMPFLAGLLWVLVVSVRIAWRGPRATAASQPATAAPVAAVGARVDA